MTLAVDIPLHDPTDGELLTRFAASPPDQLAFEDLVRRHIHWVYAAALRITRNPALAEDVAQAVLWSLARKARSLSHRPYIGGWLHEATRYSATTLLRSERRRKERERMLVQHTPTSEEGLNWLALQPHLDRAISRLPAADRDVILLRFMQRSTYEEVGATLGITPEAARKRITRALERLRQKLGAEGTPQALGATLIAAPHIAAPSHLVTTVLTGKISAEAALLSKGVLLMKKALALKLAGAAAVLTVCTGLVVTTLTAYSQAAPHPLIVPAAAAAADDAVPPTAPAVEQAPTATPATPAPASNFVFVAPAVPTAAPPTPRMTITAGPDGTSTISIGDGAVTIQGGGFAPAIPGGANVQTGTITAGGFGRTGRGTSMSVSNDGTTSVRRTNDGTNDITISTTNGSTTALVKDAAGKTLFEGPYNTDAEKSKAPADLRPILDRTNQPMPTFAVANTPTTVITRNQMSLDSIKKALSPTNAEWTDMQDRIKAILTYQRYLAANNFAANNLTVNTVNGFAANAVTPARAFILDNASSDLENPLLAPTRDLSLALNDTTTKPEDLESKVTALRAARIELQDALAKSRHKLEDSVTPRQKAILVNLQILE